MIRRDLLIGMTGAGATTFIGGCSSPSIPTADDPLAGTALMKDVAEYVAFGLHRSGSKGDVATSDWFAKHWSALGYQIEQPAFDIPNADTTVASLQFAGETVDGFAQPPILLTPPGGISAPLAMFDMGAPGGVSGRLAIVYVARQRGARAPLEKYREAAAKAAQAGAVGVVVIVASPSGEIAAINTPPGAKPVVPVLFVAEREKARIESAISAGQPAILRIEGPGGIRQARNTIARRGASGPWVIISTPQSGWFTCGGERGPGVAMSRALAEWAARQSFACRWLFIATSGHEWTDTGAHRFHETSAPEPADTALWLHLGASFGARHYEEGDGGLRALDRPNVDRSFMVSADMMPAARKAFAGHPGIEKPLLANSDTARGEIKIVIEEGYPTLAGFWGGHTLFHDPTDDARATSAEIMEPIVRSLVSMLETRLKAL